MDTHLTLCRIVHFNVTNLSHETNQLPVEAVVLPKITADMPVRHVPFNGKWKHLKGLHLADPDFNVPGSVDLLLGADLFGIIMRHDLRVGPPGTPSAIQTAFGWVLSGSVNVEQPASERVTACASVLQGDDLMRKFWEVEECVAHQPALSIEERSVQQHFDTAYKKDQMALSLYLCPEKRTWNP